MKMSKRTLVVLLAITLVVAFMVVTVSAADAPWPTRFSGFQVLRPGCRDTYAEYTIPLQYFLMSYSSSWNTDIVNAGGADGYYGEATSLCVGKYQGAKGLSSDKICGSGTWTRVGMDLLTEEYSTCVVFKRSGNYIINARKGTPIEYSYYYYMDGDIFLSQTFHTT